MPAREVAMLFCTNRFVIFFLIIFISYWLLPWRKGRLLLLLGASIYFYACWNKWLALLVCGTTVMDWLLARGMDACDVPWRRRAFLGVSIAMNLAVLCYFKYANFFLESLQETLIAAGLTTSLPVLSVILPIGISFYTFEAISYTVDVYQWRIRAERSLLHFLLFILFFPHLVAGPIVRARDFLPQVRRPKRWHWARMQIGLQYIVIGVFKKLVIADRMVFYVDPVFADPHAFGAGALWLAAFAYTLQVYCDFSGYSDLALGCAHLLGYKLSPNFDMPYLSRNISEFWRRWHMSLSSWLRDYVFIPLGGSRGAGWRVARNLLITMALAGLWHGAAWNFVIFGVIQGGLLCLHRLWRNACSRAPGWQQTLESLPGTMARIAFTYLVFTYSLVVFRAQTLSEGAAMLWRMASWCDGHPAPLPLAGFWITAAVVALGHVLGHRAAWHWLLERVPAPVQGFGLASLLMVALLLAPDASKAFVYFQF